MATVLSLTCEVCNKKFNRPLRQCWWHKNRGSTICCSRSCQRKLQTLRGTVTLNCAQCNTQVTRHKSCFKKSKSGNIFCSRSCAVTYNNKHKTHGTRRSKLEVYIEEQIKIEFPDLVLIANSKTTIGSELDFFFPELGLAIELNGIFHYKPIYGQNKLDQIVKNDKIKVAECASLGIDLIQYGYTDSHLNEEIKLKHWTKIKSILTSTVQ